jgi:PPOX class probable F420-dependent enzyme
MPCRLWGSKAIAIGRRAQSVRNNGHVCYRWTAMSVGPDRPAPFAAHRYLNLETYRRTGQPVATPVWFVTERDVIYVYTLASSGKVKRIRNNPRVLVGPCTFRGKPRGPLAEGRARVVGTGEEDAAEAALQSNYGLGRRLYEARASYEAVYLEVTPA